MIASINGVQEGKGASNWVIIEVTVAGQGAEWKGQALLDSGAECNCISQQLVVEKAWQLMGLSVTT